MFRQAPGRKSIRDRPAPRPAVKLQRTPVTACGAGLARRGRRSYAQSNSLWQPPGRGRRHVSLLKGLRSERFSAAPAPAAACGACSDRLSHRALRRRAAQKRRPGERPPVPRSNNGRLFEPHVGSDPVNQSSSAPRVRSLQILGHRTGGHNALARGNVGSPTPSAVAAHATR
jgi:hypothetical protein